MMRGIFLWAAENRWLREQLPRHRFARRPVARFMPGEDLRDALASGLTRQDFEFQMLYGIQREEQVRLAREGWRCAVLISYAATGFHGTCAGSQSGPRTSGSLFAIYFIEWGPPVSGKPFRRREKFTAREAREKEQGSA